MHGSISPSSAITNSNGEAQATYLVNPQSDGYSDGFVLIQVEAPQIGKTGSIQLYTNSNTTDPALQVETLTLDASPELVIINTEFQDSTYTINLQAIAKDSLGIQVPQVPINIINTNDEIGTLQISQLETDINGEINAVFEVSAEEIADSVTLSFEATILSPEDFSVLKNTSQSIVLMTDEFLYSSTSRCCKCLGNCKRNNYKQ